MIATTISNSINEKPFCLRILFVLFSVVNRCKAVVDLGLSDPTAHDLRTWPAVLRNYESVRF